MMVELAPLWIPVHGAPSGIRVARSAHVAPSFNGRTADSGSAYRGSNPWGAAKKTKHLSLQRNEKQPRNLLPVTKTVTN
jgi:hypothetical protein